MNCLSNSQEKVQDTINKNIDKKGLNYFLELIKNKKNLKNKLNLDVYILNFNSYIFENNCDCFKDNIYNNFSKFINNNILTYNHVIDNINVLLKEDKISEFWYNITCNVNSFGEKSIFKLFELNKNNMVNNYYWISSFSEFKTNILKMPFSILSNIVSSNYISIDTKVDIFLIILKDKLLRQDILNWIYEVVKFSSITKKISTETYFSNSDSHKNYIDYCNSINVFLNICIKIFYKLFLKGINTQNCLNKVNKNYINARECFLNFCEIDENSSHKHTEYNFMSQIFFFIIKLIDNNIIYNFDEIKKRNDNIHILNKFYNLATDKKLFTNLQTEQKRIDFLKNQFIFNEHIYSDFIYNVVKWININKSKIVDGTYDYIINIIQLYYINNTNIIYNREAFELFIYILGSDTITRNIYLKVNVIDILFIFITKSNQFSKSNEFLNMHIMLYFEEIIDNLNENIISLYIEINDKLHEHLLYNKHLIKYKFIYLLKNINVFENVEYNLNNTIYKKFIKILLEDIHININRIVNISIVVNNNIENSDNNNKEPSLVLSNYHIFINCMLEYVYYLSKYNKIVFMSPEIINTFTITTYNSIKELYDIHFLDKHFDSTNYIYKVLNCLERIISVFYIETKFAISLIENSDSNIVKLITNVNSYLINKGRITLISDVRAKYFINLLNIYINKNIDNPIEPPDELCDPIMNTLIVNPIMLPNTNTIVDEDVIKRHLLTNEYNPFNREELTINELNKYNENELVIKEVDKFKQKILDWENSL